MRIFQNSGIYRSYKPRLASLTRECKTFSEAIDAFLNDRFGAAHFLQPILQHDDAAFFTNGDDRFSQRLWAHENGLPPTVSLEDILRAQIEHHRADVFYNMDPMRYGDEFLTTLPGCVRRSIAWRAAPSDGGRFLTHDVIVNNFPTLLDSYRAQGAQAEYLSPAHDPEMDNYALRHERPVDVLFVGTFSRHHRVRSAMLEAIANLRGEMEVVMHLDISRYTWLAETPLGLVGPLRKDRRSPGIRAVARSPVFGRDLLTALSQAKIVVNGAIDMAGLDRGNMRIWEALGCGATLISDRGNYPQWIHPGKHFAEYTDASDVPAMIRLLFRDEGKQKSLADAGREMIRNYYSKALQWRRFQEIAS